MNNTIDKFESLAKIALMIIAAMLPLWFLPLPVSPEFGREVTFIIGIVAALVLWLLSLLTQGQIRYISSPILWMTGITAAAFGASTLFSKVPWMSLTFGDIISEKFSTFLLGILLMITVSSTFRKGHDIRRIVSVLVFATGISALIAFLQMAFGFSLFGIISTYARGNDFNVIGTMNGVALFYTTIFLVTLGLLFSGSAAFIPKIRYGFMAVSALLLINLTMIHFHTAWIVLLGSLILFFGLMLMYMRKSYAPEPRQRGLNPRYVILILLIAFSSVMLATKNPFFGPANLPLEVSPSFSSTIDIAKQVLNQGGRVLLLGSGPATFGLDWALYKDTAINQTQFWNIMFSQGFSWMTTLIATTGILGILSFFLFLIVSIIVFLRHLLTFPHEEHTPIGISLLVGFVATLLIAVLYPASLTFILLFFLLIGLLSTAIAHPEQAYVSLDAQESASRAEDMPFDENDGMSAPIQSDTIQKSRWWNITTRVVHFENSWIIFASSLLAIFFISLGVAAVYVEAGTLRAVLTQQNGVALFNKGDTDGAIAAFEQAISFEDKNPSNYIPLIQARIQKIRDLIQKAASGTNVQQEFQKITSLAIQNAQTAVALNPYNPLMWRLEGSLYELLIPYVPGSESFAFASYRKAMELDPKNPTYDIDLARAGIIATDRLTLTIQQSTAGANRDQMIAVRTQTLQDILTVLKKAVELKPDLADAHFLATQAALRLGNIQEAISSAEKTKLAAPFDVGVAFQLGLLYYQAGEIDKSQIEFERAVAMNNNYSNARYFLGLIYDRKNDKTRAIQQFEEIEKFNPDNQEVKAILTNLRAGKSALEKIVPPATPPEKRNESPVKEEKKK